MSLAGGRRPPESQTRQGCRASRQGRLKATGCPHVRGRVEQVDTSFSNRTHVKQLTLARPCRDAEDVVRR
jgi:hypothetical protein